MLIDKPEEVAHRDEKGKKTSLYSVSIQASGDRLATGGVDGKIRIWNYRRLIGRMLGDVSVNKEAVPPASSRSGGSGGGGRLDAMLAGASLGGQPSIDAVGVTSLGFNAPPDASSDNEAKAAQAVEAPVSSTEAQPTDGDSSNPEKIAEEPILLAKLSRHHGSVLCVRWSPDGTLLASASDLDNLVLLWRLDPASDYFKATKKGLPSLQVKGSAYSFDGSGDNVEKYKQVKILTCHSSDVTGLAWSADGRWLASCGLDNKIVVWDVGSGAPHRILAQHEGFVKGLAFDPANIYLCSQSDDKSVCLWRRSDWQLERRLQGGPLGQGQAGMTFFSRPSWAPDGRLLIIPNAWNGGVPVAALLDRTLLTQSNGPVLDASVVGKTSSNKRTAAAASAVEASDAPSPSGTGWGADQVAFVGHEDPIETVAFNPCLFTSPIEWTCRSQKENQKVAKIQASSSVAENAADRSASMDVDVEVIEIKVTDSASSTVSTTSPSPEKPESEGQSALSSSSSTLTSNRRKSGRHSPPNTMLRGSSPSPPLRKGVPRPNTPPSSGSIYYVAMAGQDRQISVWRAGSRTPLLVLGEVFERAVADLSWSADGASLVAASLDGTLAITLFAPAERELGTRLPDAELARRRQVYTDQDPLAKVASLSAGASMPSQGQLGGGSAHHRSLTTPQVAAMLADLPQSVDQLRQRKLQVEENAAATSSIASSVEADAPKEKEKDSEIQGTAIAAPDSAVSAPVAVLDVARTQVVSKTKDGKKRIQPLLVETLDGRPFTPAIKQPPPPPSVTISSTLKQTAKNISSQSAIISNDWLLLEAPRPLTGPSRKQHSHALPADAGILEAGYIPSRSNDGEMTLLARRQSGSLLWSLLLPGRLLHLAATVSHLAAISHESLSFEPETVGLTANRLHVLSTATGAACWLPLCLDGPIYAVTLAQEPASLAVLTCRGRLHGWSLTGHKAIFPPDLSLLSLLSPIATTTNLKKNTVKLDWTSAGQLLVRLSSGSAFLYEPGMQAWLDVSLPSPTLHLSEFAQDSLEKSLKEDTAGCKSALEINQVTSVRDLLKHELDGYRPVGFGSLSNPVDMLSGRLALYSQAPSEIEAACRSFLQISSTDELGSSPPSSSNTTSVSRRLASLTHIQQARLLAHHIRDWQDWVRWTRIYVARLVQECLEPACAALLRDLLACMKQLWEREAVKGSTSSIYPHISLPRPPTSGTQSNGPELSHLSCWFEGKSLADYADVLQQLLPLLSGLPQAATLLEPCHAFLALLT